jgi:uncharacterized protein (DUF305 family)
MTRMAARVLLASSVVACGGAVEQTRVESPAPAQARAAADSAPPATATPARRGYVAADVEFMQHMIVHHAQATEMTALVPTRAGRDDIRLLARRIERSQEDELTRMAHWLRARGETVPDEHAHHDPAHAAMPGMASAAELARLRAASGDAFDRQFLELMIRHHEGALVMVAQLFATPGAGQEAELFQFASHVDADQRMEIERMRRMLQ